MTEKRIPARKTPLALKSWTDCTACGLCKFRRFVVIGRGSMPADLLFIGEAPGKTEDLRGVPFIGRSGRILDLSIERATKLARIPQPPSYYITNVVGCRPTDEKDGDNREPTDTEANACYPRLDQTVDLVNPTQVILLGKVAARHLSSRFPGAIKLFHPAFILRRGGEGAPEFRKSVRALVEVFKGFKL